MANTLNTLSHSTQQTIDHQRRFGGVIRAYGQQAYERFRESHVCVIGLGGVGSWTVEALARSAIGTLTLVDLDHVAESNINRQLHATSESLGMAKTVALADRIHSINPDCTVITHEDFASTENIEILIKPEMSWVIDCIDNHRVKAALIAHCRRRKIKLITVGGAGGMTDPSKISITDLARSRHDPLLAKTRKRLRKDYGFPENPARRFDVPGVWSEEQLRYYHPDGAIRATKPENTNSGLSCAGNLGSAVVVTSGFGFAAAGHILQKLANERLKDA